MRIVFMGSAELACPCLDKLMATQADTVAGVVTQPDRPRGRSLKTAPCPVRAHLGTATIPVLTPQDINARESVQAVRDLAPDLIVVVAYGQILNSCILEIPHLGCINVHASLLPRYRGAAPIQWAVARGEKTTGVTTMYMNEAMDAGDIIDQVVEPIRDEDTAGSLHDRLAQRGADLLIQTLDAVRLGKARRIPQAHSEATYAPKLKKSDGRLDWNRTAIELNNLIRAFNPRPGCYFEHPAGKKVRIFKARVEPSAESAETHAPGQGAALLTSVQARLLPTKEGGQAGDVLEARGDGPLVQTGAQALRLLEVQPEGRKVMSGSSFLCGYCLNKGDQLM